MQVTVFRGIKWQILFLRTFKDILDLAMEAAALHAHHEFITPNWHFADSSLFLTDATSA